jgi:(1->4)-alpha-D-glucan 1-alpha-D-glucosylmutase
MNAPRATYRLQLSSKFGFEDVAKIAEYLAAIGVSHVYASPFLRARSGSPHGYDIVDHNALNPELGTGVDFERMSQTLRSRGLGLILDYVPNHMGVGGADNPAWLDVLEWGRASNYAEWFDIDWNPESLYLRDKVLVPFLGDQYGAALQAGNLRLRFDPEEGSLAIWAYDTHKLPISALDYQEILGDQHSSLERIGDEFAAIHEAVSQMPRRASELKNLLAFEYSKDIQVRHALDAAVARYDGVPGHLCSWSRLDALIKRQHWRVAFFRVAADDINYRRFFNINDLAGIRMELPDLFEHAHELVAKWLGDSTLDGLRIDHIDGLFDPHQYLGRLRGLTNQSFYLIVEKILAQHESLREDWPVDGTTGYDFVSQVTGLLLHSLGDAGVSSAYERFTGNITPFQEIVRTSKLRIMDNEMASELHALARDSARVARENPVTSDFTQNILQRALRQIVACFPIYRTYVSDEGIGEVDRKYIDWAVRLARRNEPELEPSVFDFLHRLLTTDLVSAPRSGFSRHAALRVAKKFQQFTGPVMAKGFEDNAFFIYNRMLALNEVGTDPSQFGISVSAFHKANAVRAKRWPNTMISTSTHDTKRGEDVRARLAVLSELPEEWEQQLNAWSRVLRARRGDLNGSAPPSRNDEYFFYQLLIGSWPAELSKGSGSNGPQNETDKNGTQCALQCYTKRLQAAMQKAMREARTHTNWAWPNAEYENAVAAFVQDALDPVRSEAFLSMFRVFERKVAAYGVQNSLIQLVLKLTSPGVPDLYQGCETWDLSLGDPDSRRPVNYTARAEQFQRVSSRLKEDRPAAMRDFYEHWHDGSIKMGVLAPLLEARKANPDLFSKSIYEPLSVTGPCADRICAFARQHEDAKLIVAVKLFPATAAEFSALQETTVALPADWSAVRDMFTDRQIFAANNAYTAADLFADLPVTVLRPHSSN